MRLGHIGQEVVVNHQDPWAPAGGGGEGKSRCSPPKKINEYYLYEGPFCYLVLLMGAFFAVWGPFFTFFSIWGAFFVHVEGLFGQSQGKVREEGCQEHGWDVESYHMRLKTRAVDSI